MSGTERTGALSLRTVAAKEGWVWVREGFRLLIASPAPIHMGVLFLFASLLLSSAVPVLGMVLPVLLMPVLYLGLMNVIQATQAAKASQTSQNDQAAQQHKVRAFTAMVTVFQNPERVGRLMMLGAVYALAVLSMMGLSSLFDDGFMFRHLVLGEALPKTDEAKHEMLNGMLIVLPLYVPVSMIFWFAPQLVGLHGQGILKALFFSGLGCWRNLRACAVYALAWLGVFVATNVLLFLVVSLLGAAVSGIVALITSIFLVTWLYCSFYASYVSLVYVAPLEPQEDAKPND